MRDKKRSSVDLRTNVMNAVRKEISHHIGGPETIDDVVIGAIAGVASMCADLTYVTGGDMKESGVEVFKQAYDKALTEVRNG